MDDNELNLAIAAAACRYWGAEADTACSAEEALAMVAQVNYTAVLLDVQMPGIDGLECARRIRALRGPDLFIAAISADASAETESRALSAGMNAFLAKPFRHADLARLLESNRP